MLKHLMFKELRLSEHVSRRPRLELSNFFRGRRTRMKSGLAPLGLALLLISVLGGCINDNGGVGTGSGFVWVATEGDQKVTPFTINLSSGSVSQVGSGIASGPNPRALAITPDSKEIFVANVDDTCGSGMFCNTVRQFTVNSDGSLTAAGNPAQITTPSSTALGMSMALAVDPTSALLFVANQGNSGILGQPGTVAGSISVFSIASSGLGAPTTVSSALPGEATGNGPASVVAAPAGQYLYVADEFSGNIVEYAYATSGALTFQNSYQAGLNPTGLAFSRTVANSTRDSYLFVANSGSNNVTVFSACVAVTANCTTPSGALQPVAGSPFPAGTGPSSIVVDPAADFVYAVDKSSFEVSEFKFSPATGVLSPQSPALISTGASPVSAGITSDGLWMYVANNGGSSLSAYSVGTGGKLSLATTSQISLGGQPSAVLVQ